MAGREAGNMRLFEATGVGAFLLTDFKENLHTLFEPDRDVAPGGPSTTASGQSSATSADDGARAQIAQAGQARTIAQHTYRHRGPRNPRTHRYNARRA